MWQLVRAMPESLRLHVAAGKGNHRVGPVLVVT